MTQEITMEEVAKCLDITIKHDEANKIITFLCMLSAYTEDSQFNISFNAPSSAGKTYIATEVAKLFPKEDVELMSKVSPTALFHRTKQHKSEEDYIVDLERKIIIFLDQSSYESLKALRPILSHDQKETTFSFTDRTQKSGLRTIKAIIRGFPAVINCTANPVFDEQEATRFLTISPEATQDKIHTSIELTLKKESDKDSFNKAVENDPARTRLKRRIQQVKGFGCKNIKINESDSLILREKFFADKDRLRLQHQRDIKWLTGIIKANALLNFPYREFEGKTITVHLEDIKTGFALWQQIAENRELNISPIALSMFKQDIKPLWAERKRDSRDLGITRAQIVAHHSKYGESSLTQRSLGDLLDMLVTAGLIRKESSVKDRRITLIYPLTNSQDKTYTP